MANVKGADGATRVYRTLDPATKTFSAKNTTTPAYPSASMSPPWENTGSFIDVGRNSLVGFNGTDSFSGAAVTPRLVFLNLTTNAITLVALSGDIPSTAYGAGFAHNTDDGYYYAIQSFSTPLTTIYKIDPDTGVSTLIYSSSTAAHAVSAGGSNNPLNRWNYHSAYRGFTWAPQWDSPVYFFPTA
jgi:hypothetical protein